MFHSYLPAKTFLLIGVLAFAASGCGKTVERTRGRGAQFNLLDDGSTGGTGNGAGFATGSGNSGSGTGSGSGSGSASTTSGSSTSGSSTTASSGSTSGSSSTSASSSSTSSTSASSSSTSSSSTSSSSTSASSSSSSSSTEVCNPWGGPSFVSRSHGIAGDLYSATNLQDQPPLAILADLETKAAKLANKVYLSKFSVRTRPSSEGLLARDGTLVRDELGRVLTEWYGLKNLTEIRLIPGLDQPGHYQFAIIADDGAIMKIQDVTISGSTLKLLVDNDGLHNSKLACATEAVKLDYDSRLKVSLDYFQGPKNHVALMLLWRRVIPAVVTASEASAFHVGCSCGSCHPGPHPGLEEELCGRYGNDLFFDSRVSPPRPQPAWWELVSRGWGVVPSRNYYLPPGSAPNPCY